MEGEKDGVNATPCLSWISWSCATLFFVFAFFQRTAPSVFVSHLSEEFSLSAAGAGALASSYFYAYAAVQIPLGILLDRFGPLPVLCVTALLAAGASLLFAVAQSLWLLSVARLLVGGLVGGGWLSILQISSTDPTFQQTKTSITGLSMLIGLGGGVLGQGPLALGVAQSGWRLCMGLVAVVPLFTSLALFLVWRMRAKQDLSAASAIAASTKISMTQQLHIVCSNPVNIFLAIYSVFAFAPLLAFGSLWAVPFFTQVGGTDTATSGVLASIFLIGTGIGSPLCGALSDRYHGKRRTIMISGLALSLISMVLIIFGTGTFLSLKLVGLFMFCAGLGSAPAQLLAFFVANHHNDSSVVAAALATVNTAGLCAGAIFQPLTGILLDMGGSVEMVEMVAVVNKTAGLEQQQQQQRQWSPDHMRTVYAGVYFSCYIISGFIAGFVLPLFEQKEEQRNDDDADADADADDVVPSTVVL